MSSRVAGQRYGATSLQRGSATDCRHGSNGRNYPLASNRFLFLSCPQGS